MVQIRRACPYLVIRFLAIAIVLYMPITIILHMKYKLSTLAEPRCAVYPSIISSSSLKESWIFYFCLGIFALVSVALVSFALLFFALVSFALVSFRPRVQFPVWADIKSYELQIIRNLMVPITKNWFYPKLLISGKILSQIRCTFGQWAFIFWT